MPGTTQQAWVGIDLGTQSVRALAVAQDGTPLGVTSRPLRSTREGTRHEQDPASWWAAAADALADLTAGLPAHTEVGGVAVDATSGTVAVLERDGRFAGPGIMYDDARGAEYVQAAQQAGSELWERLAYRIQPSWALPTLVQLARTGQLSDGRTVVHQGDVVNRALVGHEVATDSSQALKTGVDLTTLSWPQEVFDRLDIDTAVLPDVVLPGTLLGNVCVAAAERTGLPVGTSVLAGTTDGCAAQLGAGVLTPGQWNSVLGTTLVIKGVSSELLHDETGAVYSHRAPHEQLWLPGGASSTGAGVLNQLLPEADLDALSGQAADLDPGPPCYPLAGTGERFPFVAPEARGFIGDGPLSSANPPETFAAVAHGVAFIERLCYDLLDLAGADVTGSVALTGGAAHNAWWNQLRCNVLGVPAVVPTSAEPALGAAVLAAGSELGVREAAAALVRVSATLEPRPADDQVGPYLRLIDGLASRGWVGPTLAAHAQQRAGATS